MHVVGLCSLATCAVTSVETVAWCGLLAFSVNLVKILEGQKQFLAPRSKSADSISCPPPLLNYVRSMCPSCPPEFTSMSFAKIYAVSEMCMRTGNLQQFVAVAEL